MSYIKDATPHIIAEVTTLPTASSELEGMLVRKDDSIYLCRDSRWRKIYPPVNYGIDVPCLAGLKPSYIVWPRANATAAVSPANTLTYYVPIVVPYGCVVSAMTINVTTAASSGNNNIGIYDSERRTVSNSEYYYPNNLLRSGTVAVNSTGFKTVTFATAIEFQSCELYFLALNNPLTTSYQITGINAIIGQYFGNTTNSFAPWCIRTTGTSLANPAPTSGYGTSAIMPLFTLTLSDIFLF
jgi:hypothetical protein